MGKRGPKPGTGGRPRKALAEKLANGNPGKRPLTVIELPTADLTGNDMPKPKAYLSAKQKTGGKFYAEEIYKEIWEYLKECGCEKLVNQNLIEQYAMSYARYIQCEQAISEYGLLAKHPTTNQPISSPFVTMSNSYQNKANQIWAQIYQVVKENCSTEYSANNPHEDMMERLLRAREKGKI